MKTFININQPHIPSYNLEVASNAYNKLNEGHIQAIQSQSELQTAISQLDLNETEEDFRQSLANEIDKTVQDNTKYRNAYYALPDIIAKAGDINRNPELIGRLRAQKAYKANIASIDSRNDITDDVKEMAKAMSPYYYRDKKTGELINNGVWKPGYSPVKSYDVNDILKLIGQYVSPDAGGYSGPVSFLNIDGSTSDTWSPGMSLGVLNQSTGKWERLSEDKIKSAWDAALAANPEIMSSLRQDYKVANWKYDTKGEDTYNIIGKDGSKITFNDFVNRIIDPYAKAKSYYNKSSSIEYNDSVIRSYTSLLAEKGNQDIYYNGFPVTISTPGNPVEVENDTITRTNGKISYANSSFKNYVATSLKDSGYSVDLNGLNLDNREQSKQVLVNAGIPESEINTIMKEFDRQANATYAERKYMNELYSSMNPRGQAARKIVDDIAIGNPLDSDYFTDNDAYSRFVKQAGNLIDEAFEESRNQQPNIYFGTEDKEEFDKLINSLGGINTLKNLGYNISSSNGKYYIGIDKENSNQFLRFADAVETIRNDRSFGQEILSNITNKNDTYWMDENGKFHRWNGINQSDVGVIQSDIFSKSSRFINRMKRISERQTPNNLKNIIVESNVTPGGLVEEAQIRGQLAATTDTKEASILKSRLDAWDENLRTAFATKGIINTDVRKISDDKKDSNGAFVKLTGKDVVDLESSLQNPDTVNKIQFSLLELPTGEVYTLATVPVGKGEDKKSIKVIVEDISSPATDSYRNDPKRNASSVMYKSALSNKPEQIAFYKDDLGYDQNILLYPTMDGTNSFYVGYGDEIDTDRVISYEDAVNLKEIYNFLLNPRSLNVNSREEFENKANKYINDFKRYFGTNGLISLPNYASSDLTSIIDEIMNL